MKRSKRGHEPIRRCSLARKERFMSPFEVWSEARAEQVFQNEDYTRVARACDSKIIINARQPLKSTVPPSNHGVP